MNKFKINFQLQELDKILPFGSKPNLALHWFGLTDGLLWIDVNTQTIYEYTKEAQEYFGHHIRCNDYQIARFLEDFSQTFSYVSESIPEELYNALDEFKAKADNWENNHIDDDDDAFEQFYDNEYSELIDWYYSRSFDSGHLVGGPCIGCFRYRERIKIIWESTFKLESGSSIWTAPKGSFEMPYDEFVLSVTKFFDSFFIAMDRQVEKAAAKDWADISLDKERLVKENAERKSEFYEKISFLRAPYRNTDWHKIMQIYAKMEEEMQSLCL